MDLIYEDLIERTIPGCPKLKVEAWATGRPDDRGEISITIEDYQVGPVPAKMSPDAARTLAAILVELADKAERMSTRGFVGSKE